MAARDGAAFAPLRELLELSSLVAAFGVDRGESVVRADPHSVQKLPLPSTDVPH
jgi:hypothetical protein